MWGAAPTDAPTQSALVAPALKVINVILTGARRSAATTMEAYLWTPDIG